MAAIQTIDIIGAGGLGTPAAWELAKAAAGPVRIRIHDFDTIHISNLHRQTLFDVSDIGRPKAVVLAEVLSRRYGGAERIFEPRTEPIDAGEPESALRESALVIECSDSVETKFGVNDYCARAGIPFCYGGAVGTHGQLLFFDPRSETSGCLRCLFPGLDASEAECLGPTCREAGVLGPVVGLIGLAQAALALRFLAGKLSFENGSPFLRFDLASARSHELLVPRSRACSLHTTTGVPRRLDLREKRCPATFLYTKLALEQVAPHSRLEVLFGDAESAANVHLSVQEEGHLVGGPPSTVEDGSWRILVTKKGACEC